MSFVPASLQNILPDSLWPETIKFQRMGSDKAYADVLIAIEAHKCAVGHRSTEDFEFAIQSGATHFFQTRTLQSLIGEDMRLVHGDDVYSIVPGGVRHPGQQFTVVYCSGTKSTA
jgi:hypothetical protein